MSTNRIGPQWIQNMGSTACVEYLGMTPGPMKDYITGLTPLEWYSTARKNPHRTMAIVGLHLGTVRDLLAPHGVGVLHWGFESKMVDVTIHTHWGLNSEVIVGRSSTLHLALLRALVWYTAAAARRQFIEMETEVGRLQERVKDLKDLNFGFIYGQHPSHQTIGEKLFEINFAEVERQVMAEYAMEMLDPLRHIPYRPPAKIVRITSLDPSTNWFRRAWEEALRPDPVAEWRGDFPELFMEKR